MKKNLFYFFIVSAVILQSCSIHNPARLSNHSYLNRLVKAENVKPFERVLIVFDDYEIPHSQWIYKNTPKTPLLIDLLTKRNVAVKTFQKNYESQNPEEDIKKQLIDYNASHLVIMKQCLSSIQSEHFLLYDIEIEDCKTKENVLKGRLSTQNLPRGLIQVFEKDGFLKRAELSDK